MTALVWALLPPGAAGGWWLLMRYWRHHATSPFIGGWVGAAVGGLIPGVIFRQRDEIAGFAASLAAAVIVLWWRSRQS